ncbi:MAG: TIGR02452 family protein [Oscillospiraceae bacterium]|nr:TIGR02452 family protein [Oscillospiraceae bacterium]
MNYLKIKSENDRIFENGGFGEMRSVYYKDYPLTDRDGKRPYYSVSEHIVSMTTTECILANRDKRIIALNFANAHYPGGAYVMGGNAQEEALCRCSGLYYTIREAKEYYNANHRHILPDYTDGMIYSENVPVIRNDMGELLEKPVICSFITCPAVNRRMAAMSDKKVDQIMEKRIARIVSLAADKKPDVMIFGAFGCGVFGNKRSSVFPLFEAAINKYTDGSAEILFAVPD